MIKSAESYLDRKLAKELSFQVVSLPVPQEATALDGRLLYHATQRTIPVAIKMDQTTVVLLHHL